MSIDNDAVKSETGIGFFAGPTLKIDFLPFLGIQGAVLYEQANNNELKPKSSTWQISLAYFF